MQVVKTVPIPVHYALTKRKLRILDSLTARLSYGICLWSQLIKRNQLRGTCAERDRSAKEFQEQTELPAAMVQCCYDTAKWAWRSYRQLHREWSLKVAEARRTHDDRWLLKLLKREPQKPFSNGVQHKIPIWFDERIGTLEPSRRMKLVPWVARISTLRKGKKITIPLNPAKYHLGLLQKGQLKSFQLIKRNGRYYVHVKVEFRVPDQPVHAVRGVDLGVKRSMASVMLRPNQPPRSSDFTTIRDGLKQEQLNRLNRRVAELQKARKWAPLKRIRHKRLHVSEYYDRLAAKRVAATSQNCLVAVGYPKGIKHKNYRGNGKPKLRRALARWSYGRAIRYIQEECAEQGIRTEAPDELWSSRTCHRCGSRHTERLTQSLFHCWNCELWYNADYNAAINIGSRFLPTATTRQATDDLAYAWNEQAREIVACEPRSPHPLMGGSKSQSLSSSPMGVGNRACETGFESGQSGGRCV